MPSGEDGPSHASKPRPLKIAAWGIPDASPRHADFYFLNIYLELDGIEL